MTGLRTTVGSIPFDGVTDLAPEFDTIGPLARSAAEVGEALAALTGAPRPRLRPGARIGVVEDFFFDDLHPDVAAGMDALLAEIGPNTERVSIAGAADAGPALQVLLNAAAAERHPHWLDDPRVEDRIRERLVIGARTTNAEISAAMETAARWRASVAAIFTHVDALVCPTTPFPAPLIEEGSAVEVSRAINRCNAPWSLAQLPAISIPLPMASGLPVGGQFVAPAGGRLAAGRVGRGDPAATDWHEARP